MSLDNSQRSLTHSINTEQKLRVWLEYVPWGMDGKIGKHLLVVAVCYCKYKNLVALTAWTVPVDTTKGLI